MVVWPRRVIGNKISESIFIRIATAIAAEFQQQLRLHKTRGKIVIEQNTSRLSGSLANCRSILTKFSIN
jgi:hypothetical protein